MTASTKAPKSVKINASSDINATIAGAYSALINQSGEVAFILEVADMMKAGKASVRTVRASIESCTGTAPTIRKSHVEHFPILAGIIREVAGAKDQPIAELLKLAERVARNHGAGKSADVIAQAKDVADLAEKSPTQTSAKRANGGGKSAPSVAPLTLELAIGGSLQALRKVIGSNLKDTTTADLDQLKALLALLVTVAKNTEAKAKAGK